MNQAKSTANPQHIIHADHMNYIQHMDQAKLMAHAQHMDLLLKEIE